MSRPDRSPVSASGATDATLISERDAKRILDDTLAASQAEHTEVLLTGGTQSLTRFANNQIHQNLTSRNHVVSVHAIVGKRSGRASTNQLDAKGLGKAVDRALALAKLSPEDESLPKLGRPETYTPIDGYVAATADSTPEQRAEAIGPVMQAAHQRGLDSSGVISTVAEAIAFASSAGRFAYHADTRAHFSCTARSDTSSGWVDHYDRDVHAIDVSKLGAIAIEKAERSRNPGGIEPGKYTVILEPHATAELAAYLGFLGFGAQTVQEDRSFMSGKIGELVTGEKVTVVEDPYDPRAFGRPFDYEGTARHRVIPIERGIAKAPLYDRRTALKDGVASTGNASAPPATEGPVPYSMVLAGGESSLEEMIASTERGILLTRFWYTRVVDPRKTKLTGMTRDGTFLIENGKITRGIRNLRHNETVLGVLSRVEAWGRDPEPIYFDFNGSCVVAPAVKVREFEFTGVTKF